MLDYLKHTTFANPELFWLLLFVPAMIAWYIFRTVRIHPEMSFSSLDNIEHIPASPKEYFRHSLFFFRTLGVILLIVVLARPQSTTSWKNIRTEGIDIVLAQDISASMLAQDFKPNRLEAAKDVATDFIDNRPNDRIGLVIFSGESFTQCPLTTDHAVLKNLFSSVKTGMVADGTAIGMGLATAVSRIKQSSAKSKVIILLTDGVNNVGEISPLTAAEIAKQFGIRVYTVGTGTTGKAYSPIGIYPNGTYEYGYVDVQIDEKLLQQISEMTGGKYFRATNKKSLEKVYTEIDRMEKSIIEEKKHTRKSEKFLVFALGAIACFALEFLLRNTLFCTVP